MRICLLRRYRKAFEEEVRTSTRRASDRAMLEQDSMPKDFLSTLDFTSAQLNELINSAIRFKHQQDQSISLRGKSVALVFFNPSLRTRASMQVGIYELGGNAVVLEPGGTSWTLEHRTGVVMDGDKTEHLAEFVRVLERYVTAIGVRTMAEVKDREIEPTEPI